MYNCTSMDIHIEKYLNTHHLSMHDDEFAVCRIYGL